MLPDGNFVEPIEDADHVRLLIGMSIRTGRDDGVPEEYLVRRAMDAYGRVVCVLYPDDLARQERMLVIASEVVYDELSRFGPRQDIDYDIDLFDTLAGPGEEVGR
jgi:hypothetical protein